MRLAGAVLVWQMGPHNLPKAVVVFATWGPYHVARLRGCLEQAAGWNCVGLEVFGGTDGVFPKSWRAAAGRRGGLPIETVFPDGDAGMLESRELYRGISRELDRLNPAVVALPAWAELWTMSGLEWCRRNHIPAITMAASTRWDKPRTWWKEAIKRRIVRGFQAALAGGAPQKQYLVELGMAPEAVFTGYDVVDNEHFRNGATAVRTRRSQCGDSGLPENYFLTNCRFVAAKNLLRLLSAYRLYLDRQPAVIWDLVLVGEGPLRKELAHDVQRLGLDAHVHLRRFAGYDDLPLYYGLARGFILPSVVEPWGLVVNEALASGLPVIVSERCGCVDDLLRGKGTGLLVNPFDVAGMADAMAALSADPERCEQMRTRGLELIEAWSPSTFGKNFWRAVNYAVNSRRTPAFSIARGAYACWRLTWRSGGPTR